MAQVTTLYPNKDDLKRFIVERMLSGPPAFPEKFLTHRNPLMVTTYVINGIFAVLRREDIKPVFTGTTERTDFPSLVFLHLKTLEVMIEKYADRTSAPSASDVVTDLVGILKSIGVTLIPPPKLVS